jgi:hypothetical protein
MHEVGIEWGGRGEGKDRYNRDGNIRIIRSVAKTKKQIMICHPTSSHQVCIEPSYIMHVPRKGGNRGSTTLLAPLQATVPHRG